MPVSPPPDSLGRQPDRRTGVFADAGRTSYAAAKGMSEIDSVLAQNDAFQRRGTADILDRVFPMAPDEQASFNSAEHSAIRERRSGTPDLSEIEDWYRYTNSERGLPHLPTTSSGVRGSAPDRLEDPHGLFSPYGASEEESLGSYVGGYTSHRNLDVLNMHREHGMFQTPEGPEAADSSAQYMAGSHMERSTFNPHTLSADFSDTNINDYSDIEGGVRQMHHRISEDPEMGVKYMSEQFVGSVMDQTSVSRIESDLDSAGISRLAVYSDKYAPESTGDIYVRHDPHTAETHATVKYPGTDRRLYSVRHTGGVAEVGIPEYPKD